MKEKKQKPIIEYKRAIIYCRVSSARQVIEGDGLNSQEHRCHQKASQLTVQVAKVFRDAAVSGGLFDRPAMAALLRYLDEHPNERFVVIFDDLKRFARDVQVHLLLKTELVQKRRVRLECLNFKFEDSPTGRFIEVVMAAGAQLEREQNKEQVINKMKARLEAGYWTFCPPSGLKNDKDTVHGKILKPVEPFARIYKEAIEMYERYELNTLEQVQRFILQKYSENRINRPLSLNGTERILREVLYSGYLQYPKWGIDLMNAKHEGFISIDTYKSVQKKLDSKSKPRARKDYNADFPIRNYVLCHECSLPLTAGWYKGRQEKYGYYLCKTKECESNNKSIKKDKIENEFADLLRSIQPQQEMLDLVFIALVDLWAQRHEQEQILKTAVKEKITALESRNASLFERVVATQRTELISEYEKAISINLEEIQRLQSEMNSRKYTCSEIETALCIVTEYIKNPLVQWENSNYMNKRLLMDMYFGDKITYHHEYGFQTATLPFILNVLRQKDMSKNNLVDTGENTSNPMIDFLTRFWKHYQASPVLQNILINQ